MGAILVTDSISSTATGRSLHNFISWQHVDGSRVILAVGSPSERNSPAALPPSAVTTDLVAASTDDPVTARELWGAFLAHLAFSQESRWHTVLPWFLRPSVPVTVQMPPGALRSAVCSAIEQSAGPLRFKVTAAA